MGDKITIRDVAKLAGVSVATVSRVMNSPEIVAANKREAVENAIRALNYSPNPAARAMVGKNTDTIAIIVPGVISDIIAEIVDGIINEAERNNFTTLLFSSGESAAKEEQLVNSTAEKSDEASVERSEHHGAHDNGKCVKGKLESHGSDGDGIEHHIHGYQNRIGCHHADANPHIAAFRHKNISFRDSCHERRISKHNTPVLWQRMREKHRVPK